MFAHVIRSCSGRYLPSLSIPEKNKKVFDGTNALTPREAESIASNGDPDSVECLRKYSKSEIGMWFIRSGILIDGNINTPDKKVFELFDTR